MDGTSSERRVALLVDGDNISSAHAGRLLMRASKLGSVTVKRAYVDPSHLSNWTESHGFGIRVARQGRGAADVLLAIEAVDLSHVGNVTAFAIASGDGGFAPLALLLVERGFNVLGLGPATSPADWQKSCSRFEVIDRPLDAAAPAPSSAGPAAPGAAIGEASAAVRAVPPKVLGAEGPAGRPLAASPEECAAAVLREAGGTGLALTAFGTRMRDRGLTKADLPEKAWRAWLDARSHRFLVEHRGTVVHVHLRP